MPTSCLTFIFSIDLGLSQRVLRLPLVSLFILLVLGACGGGGGSSSEPASNPRPLEPVVPTTVSLSGSIQVAAGSVVDSDVNDQNTDVVSNDDFESAQPVPNPATVGGYANRFGRGAAGHSFDQGDRTDVFLVDLFANQHVELLIAEPENGDLDLRLYNANQQLVDSSISTTELDAVSAPDNGRYYIEVFAFSGASNYVLSIGQRSGQPASQSAAHNATENRHAADSLQTTMNHQQLVPGDVIVRYAAPDIASKHGAINTLSSKTALRSSNDTRLVKLAQSDTRMQVLSELGADPADMPKRFASDELKATFETLCLIKELNLRDDVEYAEPNWRRAKLVTPNDSLIDRQWHYDLIQLPAAWDQTTGSANVLVAVIDTGVLLHHPDLQGQFDSNDPNGFDFISDPRNAADGDGYDGDANDVGDGDVGASSFHGTHVAGTVAAATNNQQGVAGVGWNTRIMPLRALGREGGNSFDLQQAILYAAGLPNASGEVPVQAADIINLSLGGFGFSQAEQDAVTQARAAGVIVVAAAGNGNSNQFQYPASYDGVISVGAVTMRRERAPYSTFNSRVDVAAPGGNSAQDVNGDGLPDGVTSTSGNDSFSQTRYTYTILQGTSMAAPHVAGVIALMKSVYPGLTPNDMDALLASGSMTEDLGESGRDDGFGWGLINARLAVDAAQNLASGQLIPENAVLAVSPDGLNFGATASLLSISARNAGNSRLQVLSVLADENWLSVTPVQVDASGLGEYQVSVDRSLLADGVYQAEIRFVSSSNTVVVPVIIQVGGAQVDASAGYHYVVLVDAVTDQVVADTQVQVSNGAYHWQLSKVPAGRYFLFAGSDSDQDDVICDAGEACGAYLTLAQPQAIVVSDENIQALNFTSGFAVSFNQKAQSANGAQAKAGIALGKGGKRLQ